MHKQVMKTVKVKYFKFSYICYRVYISNISALKKLNSSMVFVKLQYAVQCKLKKIAHSLYALLFHK